MPASPRGAAATSAAGWLLVRVECEAFPEKINKKQFILTARYEYTIREILLYLKLLYRKVSGIIHGIIFIRLGPKYGVALYYKWVFIFIPQVFRNRGETF